MRSRDVLLYNDMGKGDPLSRPPVMRASHHSKRRGTSKTIRSGYLYTLADLEAYAAKLRQEFRVTPEVDDGPIQAQYVPGIQHFSEIRD